LDWPLFRPAAPLVSNNQYPLLAGGEREIIDFLWDPQSSIFNSPINRDLHFARTGLAESAAGLLNQPQGDNDLF
jgi:hypothetical protein